MVAVTVGRGAVTVGTGTETVGQGTGMVCSGTGTVGSAPGVIDVVTGNVACDCAAATTTEPKMLTIAMAMTPAPIRALIFMRFIPFVVGG